MRHERLLTTSLTAFAFSAAAVVLTPHTGRTQAQNTNALPEAHFHHIHLNSVNPSAAADYYTKAFTTTTKTTFNGLDAVKSGNIYLLFNKVNTPPPTQPQSAIWHFGWNTPDSRAYLARFKQMGLSIVPMFGNPDGEVVEISSDVPGNFPTKAQLDELKKAGTPPSRVGGFQYLKGPDGALIENAGNYPPTEYFNHVHLFHEDPVCAQQWYADHLNATVGGARRGGPAATAADCKRPYSEPSWPAFDKEGLVRNPPGTAGVGERVQLLIRPHHGPYVSPRGQIVDHFALSVPDLTAAVARLRSEGVKITEDIHQWGTLRAAMIEGPDLVAIELVEVK
jgi:hypothetical protein